MRDYAAVRRVWSHRTTSMESKEIICDARAKRIKMHVVTGKYAC